jgi:hypothetical protein
MRELYLSGQGVGTTKGPRFSEKDWYYLQAQTDTQYAEAGCYYKKKVRWKTLQIQKI